MKGSVDLSKLSLQGLAFTAKVSGGMLARAHAQSPTIGNIDRYLSAGKGFPRAMATFAQGYARLCIQDFEALLQVVNSGRLPAEFGV